MYYFHNHYILHKEEFCHDDNVIKSYIWECRAELNPTVYDWDKGSHSLSEHNAGLL